MFYKELYYSLIVLLQQAKRERNELRCHANNEEFMTILFHDNRSDGEDTF